MIYSITVNDKQNAALKAVAARDRITVNELVNNQMSYYLSVVIRNYVDNPVALTDVQKEELNVVMAKAKADYLNSIV